MLRVDKGERKCTWLQRVVVVECKWATEIGDFYPLRRRCAVFAKVFGHLTSDKDLVNIVSP
jgi:hypothetical protein